MARIRIDGTNASELLIGIDLINDTFEIYGNGGLDTLVSGAGRDHLDGGQGFDFASYQAATGGVTVDMLDMSRNTGWARGDVFVSIEGLIGSQLDDVLAGDNANNVFDGLSGNDTVDARGGDDIVRDAGGNDTFRGGGDSFDPDNPANPALVAGDILEYSGTDRTKLGITANLGMGIVIEHGYTVNGVVARDSVSGFEGIRGTAYADTIYGAETSDAVLDGRDGADAINGRGGNDVIFGRDGNDVLYGGAGFDYVSGGSDDDLLSGGADADTISGGSGIDTLSYQYVTTADASGRGVVVMLYSVTPEDEVIQWAHAAESSVGELEFSSDEDRLTGIENVIGTAFDDSLNGSDLDNVLTGGNGDDWLQDFWGGDDTLSGGNGDDIVWGGAGADTITGGDGDDFIRAGTGGDYVDGGTGYDTLTFGGEQNAVSIFMANPSQNTGAAAGDTYLSIEKIIGSEANDVIYGDNGVNSFYGSNGNDQLNGGGGMDTLVGGWGADSLNGGVDLDTVDYSAELNNPYEEGVFIDLLNQANNARLATGDTLTSIEILKGTVYNDFFIGDDRAFMVFHGEEGNDTFFGHGGEDRIDGGEGYDMAMFSGNRSQYTVEVLQFPSGTNYLRVTHNVAGGDGVDTLMGMEWVSFADQTLSVSAFL
jgi:Ca2+-binding RTX toxin-like protein